MVTFVQEGCETPECFKGYYADMFNNVQSELNFTYTVNVSSAAGITLKNGSWTGMIGMQKYS